MQKSNTKMNALGFRSIGQENTLICRKTQPPTLFSFFFHLKKSWKMISNFFICLLVLFSFKITLADQKFEGIIASVDSEAITTYDLSERIKLVLKSLKLEDNIRNRDSVRDRVLELLIIEKLKKIEAKNQFNFSIEQKFSEFWSFTTSSTFDKKNKIKFHDINAKVKYEDECLGFSFNWSRQYTHMPENPTSNSFQFLFSLKEIMENDI